MAWSIALKTVYRYARALGRRVSALATSQLRVFRTGSRSFDQRCAVRVTYSPNRTKRQWRAHGVYIARESATQDPSHAGFGHAGRDVDVAETLREWQESGDERLWKIIISPEFGERLDLERLTRDIVKQAERDLGTPLEWVAVTHFNTEHPHVHLVVRGRRNDGAALTLPRLYVQHGLRQAAGKACTLQLGPRTELDAIAAEEREVNERRYTSLDRISSGYASDDGDSETPTHSDRTCVRRCTPAARQFPIGSPPDDGPSGTVAPTNGAFDGISRQCFGPCRGPMIARRCLQVKAACCRMNGSDRCDKRAQIRELQGRVLIHGEEEQGSRALHAAGRNRCSGALLYYTPEMEDARSQGKLRVNNFVRLATAVR